MKWVAHGLGVLLAVALVYYVVEGRAHAPTPHLLVAETNESRTVPASSVLQSF